MKKFFILFAVLAIAFSGCKDSAENIPDVIILNETSKSLYYKDKYQIEATSISKIEYSSENEYHAAVSKDGLVTANHVGETTILLSNEEDSKTFKITVKAKSNLFPEPNVKFGDSKSTVRAKLGEPDDERDNGLLYADYSSVAPILMLFFDESDKLNNYTLTVKSAYTSLITPFLSERYLFIKRKK